MKTLTQKDLEKKNRITLATLKSFARRNSGNLFAMEKSSFSGMSDMVERNEDQKFMPTEMTDKTGYYQTGIQGVYTVGGGGDSLSFYEDETHFGIEVYNCCGTSILASKK